MSGVPAEGRPGNTALHFHLHWAWVRRCQVSGRRPTRGAAQGGEARSQQRAAAMRVAELPGRIEVPEEGIDLGPECSASLPRDYPESSFPPRVAFGSFYT